MENFNFTTIRRNEDRVSNFRLMEEPTKLTTRLYAPWMVPDGDGWDYTGGVCATPTIMTTEEHNRRREVTDRVGRKQIAARRVVPRESITHVEPATAAPREVVMVRLAGGDEVAQEIALLEHRVKELMGIAERPRREAEARRRALDQLEELFRARHMR